MEDTQKNSDNFLKYKKRMGTAGISGQLYEILLVMYFFLQGIVMDNIVEFFLASNLEEAGDFDDIVFVYKYKDNNKVSNKLFFVQAKHRENVHKEITMNHLIADAEKGDFLLKKYFLSYLEVKRYFENEEYNDLIFGQKFDNTEFIILTNASFVCETCDEENIQIMTSNEGDITDFKSKSNLRFVLTLQGSRREDIKEILSSSSDCVKLANELASSIIRAELTDVGKPIVIKYHHVLAEQVIERIDENEGRIMERFLSDNREDEIFRTALIEEVEKIKGSPVDILELKQSKLKLSQKFGKIKKGSKTLSLPCDVITESDIQLFLRKLKIFTGEPNVEELTKVIKEIIRERYKIDEKDVDSAFINIEYQIRKWWQESSNFLTKQSKILQVTARVSIEFDVRKPVTHFVGRRSHLDEVHDALLNSVGVRGIVTVTGLGGVGKTELVRKYIREYGSEYSYNVIWINAEDHTTIKESFSRLALQLKIVTKNENGDHRVIKDIVADVYKYFSRRKVLFIFDNAGRYKVITTKDDGIDVYLPKSSCQAYAIITSRYKEWGDVKSVSLDVFTIKEALTFVQSCLCETNISFNEEEVTELTRTVQCLPLALRQAVAYIINENEIRGYKLTDYIEQYQTESAKLLETSIVLDEDGDNRYAQTVMTTWNVTVTKISTRVCGKQALKILDIIAYLAPDRIPVEVIFSNLIDCEEELHTSVELLDKYSLVSLSEGCVDIHRLVQKVVRIKLTEPYVTLKNAFILLVKAYPQGDASEILPKKRELYNHLKQFLSHVDEWKLLQPELTSHIEQNYLEFLLYHLGYDSSEFGFNQETKIMFERAVSVYENHYGSEDLKVANLLVCLANSHGSLGDVHNLKCFSKKALKIMENHLGPEHHQVAIALMSLGNAYGLSGKHKKQLNCLERTLYILEKSHGEEHYTIGPALINLSNVYGSHGDHLKQKELLERAVKILEDHYGPNHIFLADALENLGNAYLYLGNDEIQEELRERALNISKNHYGDDHIRTAKIMVNLGECYVTLDRVVEGRAMVEKALEIYKGYYGCDHFETARTLVNLAHVFSKSHEYDKGVTLLENALPILSQHYGTSHMQVAQVQIHLGINYAGLNQHEKTIELIEQALPILENHFGSEHFQTASALRHLGEAYSALGDHTQAKGILEKAFPVLEQHYGSENIQVASILIVMGKVLSYLQEYEQVKEIHERALRLCEKHYGSKHLKMASAHYNLALAHGQLGNYSKSKEFFQKVLFIEELHHGQDSIRLVGTLDDLGDTYELLEEFEHAAETFEKILSIYDLLCDSYNSRLISILEKLCNIYDQVKEFNKKISCCERALSLRIKYSLTDDSSLTWLHLQLASASNAVTDYKSEKKSLKNALCILKKSRPEEDLQLSVTYLNLGRCYARLGNWLKEKQYLELALPGIMKSKHSAEDRVRKRLIELNTITPLHFYCKRGDKNKTVSLLEKSNKTDILARTYLNHTILHHAVSGGSSDILILIIERIMEICTNDDKLLYKTINAKDNDGDTPLMWAIETLKYDAIKILLRHKVDVNVTNDEGQSALHWAVSVGSIDIVKLLLDYNIDTKLKDVNGKSADESAEDPICLLIKNHSTWRK